MQEAFDALVGGFVHPLLTGKRMSLGRPIGPGCRAYFLAASSRSSTVDGEIFDALARAGLEHAPIARAAWPHPPLVLLAAAAYDLLVATDPSLSTPFIRRARPTMLSWTRTWAESVPVVSTRGDVLARHAFVERLRTISREDAVVRNWSATYRFEGRPVPWNMTVLPRLRAVRTDVKQVSLVELASRDLETAELLRAIVLASPFTSWLDVGRGLATPTGTIDPGMRAILSDRALRSAVASRLATEDLWRSGARITAMMRSLGQVTRMDIALLVQLILEMHLVSTLDTGARWDREGVTEHDAARFAAFFVASFEHPRAHLELATFSARDRAAIEDRVRRLRAILPAETRAEAAKWVDLAMAAEPAFLPS